MSVKLGTSRKSIRLVFLLAILVISMVSVGLSTQYSYPATFAAHGSISYWPIVNVVINTSKVVGLNNLSLGFQLDWHHWVIFKDRPTQRQLARDVGFKLIRVFDFRKTSRYGYPNLMPCTYWNEAAKTGTWDWTQVDNLTQAIFSVGAEPLYCLGWMRDNIQNYIPPGMAVNPNTGLPYPESYAAYAKEWVKHFKALGLPVRYYQISNEPYFYFGWSSSPKLGYYVDLWNTVARAMRSENPNILLSNDAIKMKILLDYWLTHGDDVDYLDFHKYDADTAGQYTNAEMLIRAEQMQFETYGSFYGVSEARQKWFSARGKWLPVINSESNLDSAWETGTDPRIQQMTGAVWLALVLRTAMLKGLTYSVYFEFCSSRSQQEAQGTGWGFGMINEDDNHPWYPYYAQKMMGSNLAVGDKLVMAQSSSDDIRSIAWVNQGKVNILLICKVDQTRTVILQGISGQLDISWINNMIPYQTPSIQSGKISSNEPLTINGYTVALLQILSS